MKTIVVGDLHGDWQGLMAILRATGAIGADGARLPDTEVIQLGDLIHGGGLPLREGVDDRRCAELALRLCDTLLIGNHELPHLWPDAGFLRFHGQRPIAETLREVLLGAYRDGRLVPACAHDGWLLTHAGLHPAMGRGYAEFSAGATAPAVAEDIRRYFAARIPPAPLPLALFDAVARSRGGRDEEGGIFWCDFSELMAAGSAIPQIVGHTPQPGGYARTGNLWCVDAGAALSGLVSAIVRDEAGGEWRPVVVESAAAGVMR